jgi:putative solute:sodium symporter small subunit
VQEGEAPGAPKTAAAPSAPSGQCSRRLSNKGGVASMQLTDKHKEYWQKNLRMTSFLLAIWFVATFVVEYFARELNAITFIGPLGFYMSAQGSLIIYVLIIWFYARYMNNMDKEYGVHEGEEE